MLPIASTLAEMIAAGKYDWVDKDINDRNFPVDPACFTAQGVEEVRVEVTDLHTVPWELDRIGYEAVRLEAGLAYAVANPDAQRKHPLTIAGSLWVGTDGLLYAHTWAWDGRTASGR